MLGRWIQSSIQSDIDIHNWFGGFAPDFQQKDLLLQLPSLLYRLYIQMEQNGFTLCCNAVGNYLNSYALSLLKVKKDCTCTCVEESVFAPRDELPKGILCCKIQQMSIRMASSLL